MPLQVVTLQISVCRAKQEKTLSLSLAAIFFYCLLFCKASFHSFPSDQHCSFRRGSFFMMNWEMCKDLFLQFPLLTGNAVLRGSLCPVAVLSPISPCIGAPISPCEAALGWLAAWGTEQCLWMFWGQRVTCLPGVLPQMHIIAFGHDRVVFSYQFSQ